MRLRYKSRATLLRDPWLPYALIRPIQRGEYDHWVAFMRSDVSLPRHEPHFGAP